MRVLHGKIIDSHLKEPIIGAPIHLSANPTKGAISDFEGNFSFEVPANIDFKIQVRMCVCGKNPKDVKIKKTDTTVFLKLRKCEIKKKVLQKIKAL